MSYEMEGPFEQVVLERSHQVPVLLDFWAEWCGPCRQLGPTLEKLAGEANGAWDLVKIDTEKHPELSQAAGIKSIPAVKLVHQGAIVAEFNGALPEAEIVEFLEKHIPGGLPDAGEEVAEEEVELVGLPLARQLFLEDPAAAIQLVKVELGDENEVAATELLESMKTLQRLMEWAEDEKKIKLPEAEEASKLLYQEAAAALARGAWPEALEALIAVMARDRKLDKDGARLASVAIFRVLGEEHELVQHYRRPFSSALY